MRIEVVNGDLQRALKLWEKVSGENRRALSRHRVFYGPSETRRRKDRLARQRARRAQIRRYRRRLDGRSRADFGSGDGSKAA